MGYSPKKNKMEKIQTVGKRQRGARIDAGASFDQFQPQTHIPGATTTAEQIKSHGDFLPQSISKTDMISSTSHSASLLEGIMMPATAGLPIFFLILIW